jgi:phage regulator Rha-like protein
MVKLKELREKVLKNPEAREAYEAEKKVLAEEIAEWERQKRRAGDLVARNIEAR